MYGFGSNPQRWTQKSNQPKPLAHPCEVCGAIAFRNRVGVIACDNCKLWFRKNIAIEDKKFVCGATGNCDLRTAKRGQMCQGCRSKKCLEVGMAVNYYGPALKPSEAENELGPVQFSINPPARLTSFIDPRILAWKKYSKILEKSIESTGLFIRNLKNNLGLTDNYHLFKRKAFSIYCLQISRVLAPHGLYLPKGQLMYTPHLMFLYNCELVNEMIDLCREVFKFTDDDIKILITLVYYHPTDLNLENSQRFMELHKEHKSRISQTMEPAKCAKMLNLVQRYCGLYDMHKEVTSYLYKHQEYFDDGTLFKELYVDN